MNNSYFRVNPTAIYETPKDGVIKVLTAPVRTAISANELIITGVTGKIIRVLGWDIQNSSTAALCSFRFRNGSGGAFLWTYFGIAAGAYVNHKLPLETSGYFETSLSTGLYADIGGSGFDMNVFYILYTP